MSEFQKRGDRGDAIKKSRLRLKCDVCGEIVPVLERPIKNGNNNGGCGRIVCDKCSSHNM